MTTPANVFTVPPGRPFLKALARAVLDGHLPVPHGIKPAALDLAAWTILLPTRRAVRALQEAFLEASGTSAILLPAIRPIAEGQEELGLIESAAEGSGAGADALAIPPAIGSLERMLAMTELVLAWSRSMRRRREGEDEDEAAQRPAAGAETPAQAARLASELARLVDIVETECVSLSRLDELVPENFSAHWQRTLDFLKIITEFWPAYLAEQALLAPADRRNRLILAEARRLVAHPPDAPVIVAGVTGSVPATGELMRAVAGLAHGAIVLPALDGDLDATTFARIAERHPEHPQFGLARLIGQLGLAREAIAELPGGELPAPRRARNRLVSEAMRPSGTLGSWRTLQADDQRHALATGLAGVSLIEAPSADDEAEAVALILREAAETPGRTAALVSPDRLLARRVAVRLEAWGIRVDDSAGRPFAKTVPGAFLDLVAGAIRSDYAPAALMALLKHPLTRLGLAAGDVRRAARNLELAAFRATYLGRGLDGVSAAVERAKRDVADGVRRHPTVARMREEDWVQVRELIDRLTKALAPLRELGLGDKPHPLSTSVRAHVAAAEAIARPPAVADTPAAGSDTDATSGAASEPGNPLWARDEGAAASALLARLMTPIGAEPHMPLADYPDFLRALVATENVRTRVPTHPRLFIWGPYEARLQQTDVVVLGSLNEGVWPKATDPGPWLNRGMRTTLGLPSPEEETGRAAHDIIALMGADTVILTRASKVGGVPMVASRWLLRLRALLDGLRLTQRLAPVQPWAAWARARDLAPDERRAKPPEPRPPVAMRPRRLSVSDVETWIANPYAIYARRILRLEALPLLAAEPGASERGQIVHETLARFTRAHAAALPADIVAAFMRLGDEVIGELGAEPRVKAFWRPRLARFAEWFAASEPARRAAGSSRVVEIAGRHVLAAPAGPFTLTARADRIDVEPAGLVITDYKTGALPSAADVESGAAPQLPLEAAMAAAGVFPEIPAGAVAALRYIRATGGEPAGEERLVKPKDGTVGTIAAHALGALEQLVAAFDQPDTPYRAVRRRSFDYTYDDYAHLARVGEWSADGGEGAP